MKDDQEFNIWFVKEIEKYPCLYSHSDQNYSNRQKQDDVWLKIAKSANVSGMYLYFVKNNTNPNTECLKKKKKKKKTSEN